MKATQDEKIQLIESVEPFIFAVAHRLSGRGVEYDDLVQTGYEGALRAVDKFDSERGFTFFTYAGHWIMGSINNAINNEGRSIKIPPWYHHSTLVPISKAIERLREDDDGIDISVDDLLKDETLRDVLTEADIIEGFYWLHNTEQDSLDIDEAIEIYHEFDVDEIIHQSMQAEKLVDLLGDYLSARDAAIIRLRFGLDGGNNCTLQEVADLLEISRERVRQLENAALEELQSIADFREMWLDFWD